VEAQQIQTLTLTFEGHAQRTENGVEFWLARDLQHLLGYGKWENFQSVISKARTACEVSGHAIADHFADVGKMVDLGSGSRRGIRPERLTSAEDVKKIERRLTAADKKALQKPDRLPDDE
jgi:DNA-damage-inducible protein D